jgi:Scramblase
MFYEPHMKTCNMLSYVQVPTYTTHSLVGDATVRDEIVPLQLQMQIPAIPRCGKLADIDSMRMDQKQQAIEEIVTNVEALSEFTLIGTSEDQTKTTTFVAREASPFWGRFFFKQFHAWDMTLSTRDSQTKSETVVAKYHRPLRCIQYPGKLCCYQTVTHTDAWDERIGETVEVCYCCVPRFNVKDQNGNIEFILSRPTCWAGLCVDYCAEGFFRCKVPFYIFPKDAKSLTKGNEKAKIVKIWSGLWNEMCGDADNFEIEFPKTPGQRVDNSAGATNARLVGSAFLLNSMYFEGDGCKINHQTSGWERHH